jgi:hypothetical protein
LFTEKNAKEYGKRGGRPKKGESFAEMLDYYSDKKNVATGGRETYRETIVRKLIEQAAEGEIPFIKEYMDRLLGKPRQAVEHGGGVDLKISIDWADGTEAKDQPGIRPDDPKPETV